MGIGDWFKKKKQEQLKQVSKKADVVVPAKKEEAKEVKKETVKKEVKEVKTEKPKKETKKETPAPVVAAKKTSAQSFAVLLNPMVTEKAAIGESVGKYAFKVARWASKHQIKKAVFEIYGVTPIKIAVANVGGRRVRFGRHQGKRGDYKKAIISLPQGKILTLHKGV